MQIIKSRKTSKKMFENKIVLKSFSCHYDLLGSIALIEVILILANKRDK